ncbi:DUF6894 family protein [Microvirga lotononidis]|uniref:DUF6894 domain-containing protein n=1 Tax=Microvirga lotononidis TaxID=864069 RepID=I4Z4P3_9HYPH|nr:hypothetical protein [Microvirga lotononidis]EIM31185.1 hypothetical protein MicloDRAFT_00001750 [Microvirga lotononidis]WQO30424.1 hypothetical protein U0023_23485 [Microvirga lotononidis]
MPLFYFDVIEDEKVIRDDHGVEYPDLEAAESEAARSAAEIGHDRFTKGNAREITVQVKDENRYLLLTVSVVMTVRKTVRALA